MMPFNCRSAQAACCSDNARHLELFSSYTRPRPALLAAGAKKGTNPACITKFHAGQPDLANSDRLICHAHALPEAKKQKASTITGGLVSDVSQLSLVSGHNS